MNTPVVAAADADSGDPNANSPLVAVPLEVLLQITSRLTTPELGNFRLTCKAIEGSLLTSFAREFFTKRQFMITEFSLQALADISKSRFSPSLKHVIIGLERPILEHELLTAHDNTRDRRIQRNRILQEYVGQQNFLNTGQDVELLTEAFSKLQNLEVVGIRDFCSLSRTRDFPNLQWRSYGVSTFVSETGTARSPYRMFSADALNGTDVVDQHLSRVFLNLLRALGKAGSRPREFQVILRHCSLHDHAFHLPKYTEAIVEPVLASIGTMFLDVTTDFYGPYIDTDDQKSECRGYNLRRFLARVPRLQHLRLNLRGRYTEQLFSWFSKRAPGSTLSTKSGPTDLEWPAPVELPNLKQLDLGMITISPESILGIIRKFQSTLRTISLHKVILLDRDREKLSEKVNLWTELFRQLSQLHLELSAMNLSLLSQDVTDRKQPQRVAFNNSRDPKSRKWAGPDVQSGLRDLITDTVIDWAGYDTEGLKSDESGTEDSDVSMEDNDGDEIL